MRLIQTKLLKGRGALLYTRTKAKIRKTIPMWFH